MNTDQLLFSTFHENNIMIILKNLMRNSYENLLSDNIIRTKQSRDDQFNYPSVGDMSGKHIFIHLTFPKISTCLEKIYRAEGSKYYAVLWI